MKRIGLLILSFSHFLIFSFSHFLILPASAQTTNTLPSPDGRILADIGKGSRPSIGIVVDNQWLMGAELGIEAEVDGKEIGGTEIKGYADRRHRKENIVAPNYRQARFQTEYNEMTILLDDGLSVELRAYNEGIAFRYVLPKAKQPERNRVIEEITDFSFPEDYMAYVPHSTNEKKPEAMAFQATYQAATLSKQSATLAFLPLTIDCGQAKLTLMESDVKDYPGMFVQVLDKWMAGKFSHRPKTFDYYPWRRQKYVTESENYIAEGVECTPWRIIAVAHEDRDMPTNNLVYAFASPSRIQDTSWIQPGHVAWDWWNDWGLQGVDFQAGINNDTYKYYIDFAAKHRLEYVILDEGWYEPRSGDMLSTIPEVDLPMLVRYANERGVRLILWTVFNVLDEQLEEACARYAEMGIAGFKVDFLDRNDQEAIQMTYRIAEACARHHLVLDYHGIFAPQGIQRTWPNVINFESVFGMEEVKWTKHDEQDMPLYDVTFPFIRGQAGYVDFTPGGMRNATRADFQPIYSNPLTMGTRCHQLAHYIVHESPLTMLADSPSAYEREPECTQFIASLPPIYQSLRVVDGRLGEYIIVLRTDAQGNLYLAGETNWDERDITLPLANLLPKGVRFDSLIFTDGGNANKVATDYRCQQRTLTSADTLHLHMASGGGFAIRLQSK